MTELKMAAPRGERVPADVCPPPRGLLRLIAKCPTGSFRAARSEQPMALQGVQTVSTADRPR